MQYNLERSLKWKRKAVKQTVAGIVRESFQTCGLQLAGVQTRDEVIWLCQGMGV